MKFLKKIIPSNKKKLTFEQIWKSYNDLRIFCAIPNDPYTAVYLSKLKQEIKIIYNNIYASQSALRKKYNLKLDGAKIIGDLKNINDFDKEFKKFLKKQNVTVNNFTKKLKLDNVVKFFSEVKDLKIAPNFFDNLEWLVE